MIGPSTVVSGNRETRSILRNEMFLRCDPRWEDEKDGGIWWKEWSKSLCMVLDEGVQLLGGVSFVWQAKVRVLIGWPLVCPPPPPPFPLFFEVKPHTHTQAFASTQGEKGFELV